MEGLVLDLRLAFTFEKETWYKQKKYLAGVVDAMAKQPFFGELKFGAKDGYAKRSFDSVDAAKKMVVLRTEDGVALMASKDDDTDLVVIFSPGGILHVTIRMSGAVLARHRDTIIDQLATAAIGICAALAPVGALHKGHAFPVYQHYGTFDYPRPRPPRRDPQSEIASVIEIIDVPFHRSGESQSSPERVKYASLRTPKSARRTKHGELVVIRWAANAHEEELQRGLSAREVWLGEVAGAAIQGGYDERGDKREDPRTVRKKKITHCAVDDWKQAKKITDRKQTKLILPSRELALEIAEEARAAGFLGVLYAGKDGALWDPDPPGIWLTPPAL
jgi:hypothetical protein